MNTLNFFLRNNLVKLSSNQPDILKEIKNDWFAPAHLPGLSYKKQAKSNNPIAIILTQSDKRFTVVLSYENKKWSISATKRKVRARDLVLLSLQASTYINELNRVFTAHASMIKNKSGGVLLCGGTGSGKTLLEVAAKMHGWELVSNEFTSLNEKFKNIANITNIHLDRGLASILKTKKTDITFENVTGLKTKLVVFLKLYKSTVAEIKEVSFPNKYFYLYETFSRITKSADNLMTEEFDIPYFNLEDSVSSRNRATFVKTMAEKVKVVMAQGNYKKVLDGLKNYL